MLYSLPVCVQSHSGWWPASWCWCTDAGQQWPGWDPSSPQRADETTFQPAVRAVAWDWDQSSGPHILPLPENAPGTDHPHRACKPTQHKTNNLSLNSFFGPSRKSEPECWQLHRKPVRTWSAHRTEQNNILALHVSCFIFCSFPTRLHI